MPRSAYGRHRIGTAAEGFEPFKMNRGFVFSLASELALPVIFAGVGEKIEDLEHFDAKSFVEAIL